MIGGRIGHAYIFIVTSLLLIRITTPSPFPRGFVKERNTCNLFPSELGPDWYKIPRPLEEFYNGGHEESYYHMPCAATTLFDQGLCGCTTVVSMLFSAFAGFKQKTPPMRLFLLDQPTHGSILRTKVSAKKSSAPKKTVGPKDIVKAIDTPEKPNERQGSIFLNTKTGEVTSCPFRPSPDGGGMYLVRQPNNRWQSMQCAEGTLFQQRTCTCVHNRPEYRDSKKEINTDIVVLTPDHGSSAGEGKISKSLNIKKSDVLFDKLMEGPMGSQGHPQQDKRLEVTPDVKVVLDPKDLVTGMPPQVSDHVDKVPNVNSRYIYTDQTQTMPSGQQKPADNKAVKDFNHFTFTPVLTLPDPTGTSKTDTQRDPVGRGNIPDTGKRKDAFPYDEIVYPLEECLKKPVPHLGPQYLSIYLYGVGWVPYTCHGRRIYNHQLCACVATPEIGSDSGPEKKHSTASVKPEVGSTQHVSPNTVTKESKVLSTTEKPKIPIFKNVFTKMQQRLPSDATVINEYLKPQKVKDSFAVEEVNIPMAECRNRPELELGPEYFSRYIWGVGWIPYRCTGQQIFKREDCACVLI